MSELIKYWDDNLIEQHVGQDIGYVLEYFRGKDKLTYIDIGANVGKIYDCLSKNFIIEKCIMVEASKRLHQYLVNKFANNTNVEIHNMAISNVAGNFSLWEGCFDNITELHRSINLGLSKLENREGDTKCVTMDYFLERVNTIKPQDIDLIKIDTENKDLYIIRDMTEWVAKNKIQPFILFENNYNMEMSIEEAQTYIDKFCSTCKYEPLDLATAPGDSVLRPIHQ